MRVFFCHANEDKPVVEQVFQRIGEEFPDVKGWLDTYEVVAGQDLIHKIAELVPILYPSRRVVEVR